jgi:glycosyltransferase involved in cell wall biosynthesis
MRRLENLGAGWADVVTAVTDTDLEYYARLKKGGRTVLMPFAYSPNATVAASRQQEDAICFIGSMDWGPNVAAAEYLVRKVMPLVWSQSPEAKCFLIGRNPTEPVRALAAQNVVVTGRVPAVSEYYDRASVIVVPMQEVGGVKVKLIEALAGGKAVVTTSAGKAGLAVQDGKQLIIADNPVEFAKAITRLLEDKGERERLGTEARRFVAEKLSPGVAQRQVQKILDCLPVSAKASVE